MQTSELRQLSVEKLESKLLDLRKVQFSMRLKKSTGSLTKTHHIGQTRKTIARLKTVLSQKQSEVARGE